MNLLLLRKTTAPIVIISVPNNIAPVINKLPTEGSLGLEALYIVKAILKNKNMIQHKAKIVVATLGCL